MACRIELQSEAQFAMVRAAFLTSNSLQESGV